MKLKLSSGLPAKQKALKILYIGGVKIAITRHVYYPELLKATDYKTGYGLNFMTYETIAEAVKGARKILLGKGKMAKYRKSIIGKGRLNK